MAAGLLTARSGTPPEAVPWRTVPGGLEVRVRAQPRARRAGVTGVVDGADGPRLRVAVSAPPEDGRATRAVQETLAAALGVAPSRLVLTAGATAREKCFRAGGDAAEMTARLKALLRAVDEVGLAAMPGSSRSG